MGTLNSTKYGLVTRAVSTTQDVLPNDTALVCDISDGSISLNLCTIPDNSWQTSYKLYVSISAIKTGNVVRIQAGDGQKINGQSYLDLTSIDYVALIRVTTNNTYIAQLNYNDGAVAIKDEGTTITSNVMSIDFIGDGVSATAVGNAVTVDVPNVTGGFLGVVSLTSKTLPISAAGTRRVASGDIFNSTNSLSYDTVLEYGSFAGASTFNATTGIWTCPATGYYDITCFLALIANANPNENAITPNYWQGNGTGSANIEAIAATPHNIDFNEYIGSFGVCAEGGGIIYCQQHVPVYFDNSCINISGTYTGRYVAQGTQIYCRFLNKTQLIGGGVAGSSFHFSVKRVY